MTEGTGATATAAQERWHLSAAIEETTDVVFVATADERLTYLNRAGRELRGWSTDEDITGRPLAELYPAEAYETIRELALPEAIQHGTWRGEISLSDRGGEPIHASQVLVAHRSESGEPERLSGIIRAFPVVPCRNTIVERRRAQQYLDVAGVIILALDMTGRVTLINRAGCEVLGYREEEILGESWLETFVPPRHREEMARVILALREGRTSSFDRVESAVSTRSGQERLLVWTHSTMSDDSGAITGTLSSGKDITERKRAQDEQRRLIAIIENSTEFIGIASMVGAVEYVNDAGLALVGLRSQQEARSKSIVDFVTPEIARWLTTEILPEVIGVGHASGESKIRHFGTGEEFPIAFNLFLVRSPDSGEPVNLAVVARDITEQKRTEKEIKDNEIFLSNVINSIQDGLSVIDTDLTVRRVNRVMSEWYAASGPLEGQRCFRCYHHGDGPCDPCPSIRAMRSGKLETDVVPGPPGSPIEWVELFSYPLKEQASGEVTGVVELVRDITDRVAAEAALHKSEGQHRIYVENAPEGIFITDRDGRYIDVNEAACRMTGYRRDQLLQMSLYQLAAPESPRSFAQLKSAGRVESEVVIKRADGEHIYASLRAVALSDQRFMAFCSDITEQRRTQDELRASEERFRLIATASVDEIWQLDREGNIIYESPAVERIHGFTPEEATELHFTDLVCDSDLEQASEAFRRTLTGETRDLLQLRSRRKDGSSILTEVSMAPVYEGGEVVGVLGISRDITERKRAEDERAKLEEQLHQSQKMEAIGRLAGGVAHDFNNILTGISGYSEIILSGLRSSDPLFDDMEEIRKAAERAALLTAQLLAFSRKQIVAPKVLRLDTVVESSERMLRRIIGEDVSMKVISDRELWSVRADPGQIDQILVNLSVNSRDAMPTGGRLTIELRNMVLDEEYARTRIGATPGDYVVLSVSDTGRGMDAETRKRVFEPFFTTKPTGEGTGLGLSTVYGIVSQNGGFVSVYSEPGMGTTIETYFPRICDEPTGDHERRQVRLPRGSETILLVEDESMVRKLARRILEQQGYQVLEAGEGGSAYLLSESFEGHIDLLLTDVVMPQMNGKDLYERLKGKRPDLRALFMSGYTEDTIAHHGVLEEKTHFIHKPFTIESLSRKVREVLSGT